MFINLQDIYWREPLFLLLALQPLLIFLIKQIIRKNNYALFAEKKLQPWVIFNKSTSLKKQVLSKNTFYLLAWCLFAIALAGPRVPLQQADKTPILGANIMFVVDLSPSMQAADIIPNRLRRAKLEIFEFLASAQQHRIGITVFSARPHLYVPLTSDYAILKTYLDSLDSLILPTLGSDPVAALLFAEKELAQVKGKSAIVLVSDGDFSEIKNTSDFSQLDSLKKSDIPLYILGMGTVEGEAVPLKNGSWLKDEQQAVVSQMNEDYLQQLAKHFNGKYSPVYDDASDWHSLYQQGLSKHKETINVNATQRILWKELFPYALFPALLLFVVSLSRYRLNMSKNLVAFGLVFLLSPITDKDVFASSLNFWPTNERAAHKAYENMEYEKAAQLYKTLNGYRSHLGQGNSLYKRGHYQDAIQQFTFAIINAETDEQRVTALYNLGNSYFRTGKFKSAISTFNDALRYQPNHRASLANLNTSKVLLKAIERRAKENAWATEGRQGSGPRSTTVADGSEINDNTTVSLSGSENKKEETIPLPDLPNMSKDTLNKLISIGLKNIQLAEQNNDGSSSTTQYQEQEEININLIRAEQKTKAITDTQHLLWKRVFEIEEGFPAPIEKPHTLPEVKPW